MLERRVFGDAPLPAWAEDEAAFRAWVACPEGRPRDWPKPAFRVPADEAGAVAAMAAWKQREADFAACSPLLAWALDGTDSFSFGWGGIRFRFFHTNAGAMQVAFDGWGSGGWRATSGSDARSALKVLTSQAGVGQSPKSPKDGLTFDLFDISKISFSIAPWAADRWFSAGGVPYVAADSLGSVDLSIWQFWVGPAHRASALRWIRSCLRRAARRVPALKALWAAARVHHADRTPFSWLAALTVLARTPDWVPRPLAWLSFSRKHLDVAALGPAKDPWDEVRRPRNALHELPFFFYRDFCLDHSLGLQVGGRALRFWAQRLSLSQARRLFQAALSVPWDKMRSHPVAVAHALVRSGRGVPSVARLSVLMRTSSAMAGWLYDQAAWRETNITWPFPSYALESSNADSSHWKNLLTELRADFQRDPAGFRAWGRAAQAWLEAPTRRKGLTAAQSLDADREVFEQIQSPALAAHLDWTRLGRKAPWAAYATLARRARRLALAGEPMDMQEALPTGLLTTPGTNADDRPWPSALGPICLGGVRVYPLCRPSHLANVGEFLQNCVTRDRHLDSYVAAARERGDRFFRLEEGDAQAMLHLNRSSAWTQWTLLGRFNQPVGSALQKAGEQVAAWYAQLEPAERVPSETLFAGATRLEGQDEVPQPLSVFGRDSRKASEIIEFINDISSHPEAPDEL